MIPPLELEVAQAKLLDQAVPLSIEKVETALSAGRWLAEAVVAYRTQPWTDLSAMDGFATAGPGPWRIVGESAAGQEFAGALSAGEATRISTGAAMPAGADAVLLAEDSDPQGDVLQPLGGSPSPRHIRRAGFDFVKGDRLFDPGSRIGPAQLALAITAGVHAIDVHRLPRVSIIDTGDELSRGEDDDRPDRLPASNGAMVASMCTGLAEQINRLGPVLDDRAALRAAFEGAANSDVIITSGGASIGEHDLVRPVLEDWGAALEFWRVAIRPGKPLLVARRGTQWILGLPGNPASAFVTAFLFVLPLLRRLGGADQRRAFPPSVAATLQGRLQATGSRREFVRGVLSDGVVHPIAERDSSALRALAAANCLIDRAAGSGETAGPIQVRVYPFMP